MSLDAGTTLVCGRTVRQRPPECHDERPRRVRSPAPFTSGDHQCQDSLRLHPPGHNRPAGRDARPTARAGRARPAAGISRARCPIRSRSASAGSPIPHRPMTTRHLANPSPGPPGRARWPQRSWPRLRPATTRRARCRRRRRGRGPRAGRGGRRVRCRQPGRSGAAAGRAPPGKPTLPARLAAPGRQAPAAVTALPVRPASPGRPRYQARPASPGRQAHHARPASLVHHQSLTAGRAGSRKCWPRRWPAPGLRPR